MNRVRTRRVRGARRARRGRWAAAVVALTLTAGVAWGFWSAGSVPGGNGAAAATLVNQGATPTVSGNGVSTVVVSWAARTLGTGRAVTGYQVNRYAVGGSVAQTIGSSCAGTVTALTCTETNVPSGSWQYTVTPVFSTNWRGAESAKSLAVATDQTPPVNAVTLSGAGGSAYKSGSTVFYRGVDAGSLTFTNALTDTGSGPASSQTTALGGTSTGWTHTPSTVSTPAGGPFVSNTFNWAAGTGSSPTEVVTGRDAVGNSADTSLTLTNDSSSPNYGSLSYPDGYTSGRSVTLTFTSGNDDGASGVNESLGRIKRFTAPLSNGVCGSYVANNYYALAPVSPYVDTNVSPGACYIYQYVVTDNVGNKQFYSSTNVAKVDYAAAVRADASLRSTWRFGETAVTSSDTFTDTNGAALASHVSQDGSTWTRRSGDTGSAVITNTNNLRNNATGAVAYYTDEVPPSPDYLVETNLIVRSVVTGDAAGVVGRLDPTGSGGGTFYSARYSATDSRWELLSTVNGSTPALVGTGTYPQTLTGGQTYRVGLDMKGSKIQLLVDGVVRVSGTDTSITAAGRAGLQLSNNTTPATATTGLNLDNFDVSPPAVDSTGTNTADYHRGVQLGTAGILSDNTAATFDGVDDYMKSTTTNAFPVGSEARSVEVWFKTPGLASGQARQALFSYGTGTDTQEFGVWLEANGTQIKSDGGGASDRVLTWSASFNNNQWHHFVSTYDGTSTKMYVDGVLGSGSTAATRNTVVNPTFGYAVGAILDPSRTSLVNSSYFNGSLDEMSFYSTALSQATITNHYQLGSAPAPDFTGPTGGSVDATGLTGSRYSTSTTLNLALVPGTDPSGLATSGFVLQRSAGTLSAGTCSAFGSYTQVGANDPTSPRADTVPDGACYRYQYVVLDVVGNPTTYTSGDIKVDATPPTVPTLAYSGLSNASAIGSTVYYRPAATTGGFTVTAASIDPSSGVGSYTFPALGTGWTSTPGGTGVQSYSWAAASPAVPSSPTVTATNLAGGVSAPASLTVTPDSAAPTAGTVSYADGSTSGTTVSVAFTAGTDAGSGLGTRLLQRAAAPATGSTCGTYGSFTTTAAGTNPTSPVVDTIAQGSCYKYQYVVADNVGNQTTATSPNVAHTSFGAYWRFDAGTGSTATDFTGNGNAATLQPGAGWTAGKVGPYALSLTGGSTSWAGTANPVVDTSQSFSVAAWARFDSLSGFQTVVGADGSSVSPFYLQKTNAGPLAFTLFSADSTSAGAKSVSGLTPVAGTWYHLVGVYTKATGTIELFVNGVSQGTATGASGFTASGGVTVGRAKYAGGPVDLQTGAVDDVHLYDRAITPAEVTALANPDVAGPTGGSVDATGLVGTGSRYSTSTTLTVAMAPGTDPSGIATSGAQLLRATGTLTSGVCGSVGGYAQVGANDPSSPYTDVVVDNACYRYRYVVSDTQGNVTTYTSGDIKVDTTAPSAPSLVASAFSSSSASAGTVYYRPSATSGGFTVTAGSTDAGSGVAGYVFPAFGAGWTSTTGAGGTSSYSWSAPNPTPPAASFVTASNNAGSASSASPLTVTPDSTAPDVGTITYPDRSSTATSVTVGLTTGNDTGSGVGTRLLQRASAPLAAGTCGTYSGFATVTGGTNPTSPFTETVTAGSCYRYQYVTSDAVGNSGAPATSASVVIVAP